MDILGIDSPDEFAYFDHMADLLEYEGEIPFETFYHILADASPETLAEIISLYFEDILTGVHDDGVEFYTLLTTIQKSLEGLAEKSSDPDVRRYFAEELYRFRNWYNEQGLIKIQYLRPDKQIQSNTILEALSLYRVQKFVDEEYAYDYQDALDYPIDDYAMSLSYTVDMGRTHDSGDDDDLDQIYEDGLIHPDLPVIDGEFDDDKGI